MIRLIRPTNITKGRRKCPISHFIPFSSIWINIFISYIMFSIVLFYLRYPSLSILVQFPLLFPLYICPVSSSNRTYLVGTLVCIIRSIGDISTSISTPDFFHLWSLIIFPRTFHSPNKKDYEQQKYFKHLLHLDINK